MTRSRFTGRGAYTRERRAAPPAACGPPDTPHLAADRKHVIPFAHKMSKGRVLVIDDDEWVCRLLSVAMNEAGFEVTITENAAEGFFRAVEDQPDCIVCDVDLPDHNGYWVARKIRQHPSKVAIVPIVFLSGLDDREHRLEGFQVGGDAYLTKPFRIDEVVAQVDALIQMAARLRQARQTLASIPPSGHAMVGNLAQMSVATVLTLLDLERRSGALELSSESRRAKFVVVSGSIAESTVGDKGVPPLETLRIVMGWETGRFAFSPSGSPSSPGGELVPINALLMEAARLEDEARANPGHSERPSSARMAWRESLQRSNAPPRDTNPPSSMQSVDSYLPPPPSETPAPVAAQPAAQAPTFGAPPVPPPPPSSLKPLLPPDLGRPLSVTPPAGTPLKSAQAMKTPASPAVTPSPAAAPSPRLPGAPAASGGPRLPNPVVRPTKPSMPIAKTGFGAPMRSLSPTKVKAVVPPPPPSKPPPTQQTTPTVKEAPPESVDTGWSEPPPPDEPAKEKPAGPSPPRPQRAGQGGGEG